ncbi:MAG: hypothetical protein ABSF94_12095 [Steroidobacteraceae bacterium]|jgi:hypothetical protein
MIATKETTFAPKKDLHIGGLGPKSAADPTIWASELVEDAGNIADRVREAIDRADEFVRARPWQAIGVAALLSLAAGWLIATRRP